MAASTPIRYRLPRKDLTGQRFGKLTVETWHGGSRWNCRCDCGGTSVVLTANLKRGNTRSCGCIRNHMSSTRNTRHGLHDTHVYKTWISIRRRCLEPNNISYKQYGAKGITVCDEWANDLLAFVRDVGHPPSAEYTLRKGNAYAEKPPVPKPQPEPLDVDSEQAPHG